MEYNACKSPRFLKLKRKEALKLLISETATVVWNAKIKTHYVRAGYTFTKMGDGFVVRVSDLTPGSNVKVLIQCDYCGKQYTIPYYRYLNRCVDEIEKDCCTKCKKEKIRSVLMKKYGVTTPDKVDGAMERAKETNLKLYGVENPFAAKEIKEKIVASNLKKYGTPYPTRTESVQSARRKTCMEKYGVDSPMKLKKYRDMFSGENSPSWKPDKTRADRERDRSCPEYREWRTKVFQRDHYRCQRCGGRGTREFGVEAHHVENYNTNPNLRFDINNGVTLCHRCHQSFHSTYGKRNNNRVQLIQFLSHGNEIC